MTLEMEVTNWIGRPIAWWQQQQQEEELLGNGMLDAGDGKCLLSD